MARCFDDRSSSSSISHSAISDLSVSYSACLRLRQETVSADAHSERRDEDGGDFGEIEQNRIPGVEGQLHLKGFKTEAPNPFTSAALCVTNVRSWTLAVAASKPSITGTGRMPLRRPHSSATAASTGRARSPKAAVILPNHSSSARAWAGSRHLRRSSPFRISPRTRTLRQRSSSVTDAYQDDTPELQRSPFLISEITLVSMRYFTARSRAPCREAAQGPRPRVAQM